MHNEKESIESLLNTIKECRDENDKCMVMVPTIDNKLDIYKISWKAVQLAMKLEQSAIDLNFKL